MGGTEKVRGEEGRRGWVVKGEASRVGGRNRGKKGGRRRDSWREKGGKNPSSPLNSSVSPTLLLSHLTSSIPPTLLLTPSFLPPLLTPLLLPPYSSPILPPTLLLTPSFLPPLLTPLFLPFYSSPLLPPLFLPPYTSLPPFLLPPLFLPPYSSPLLLLFLSPYPFSN